jgi:LysR family transcriptional regulator for metE and metH
MNAAAPPRPAPIDTRTLRLVLAIVDEGGLTRAARRLNLTQSALSHQLKQVEGALGVTLFLRQKRSMVLTDAGQRLLERARPIVADLDALGVEMRDHAAGARGRLRIATECYTCYEWLPPVLLRFHRRYPGIDVGIVAEATSDPLAALDRGDIDLAIITRGGESSAIETLDLFRDELLLVVPPDHPLSTRRFVRPRDLEREHLLLYTPPSENFFYRDFFSETQRPGRVDVVRLTEAILSMVRAGLGVTVAAAWAIAPELATGKLVGVRIGARGYRRDWMAAVRRSPGPHPARIKDFVRLVAATVSPAPLAQHRGATRARERPSQDTP